MINLGNMPEHLQKYGLFCLWKYEERDGRKTKVPYNPKSFSRGNSADRNAFVSFSEISEIWERVHDQFNGIGVGVFDQIGAIDIDHCFEGGELSAIAHDIVDRMNSYTEISPSGEGIRIFFGILHTDWYSKEKYYINNRDKGLEVYLPGTTNRFLTFTGDTLRADPIRVRTKQIKAILDDYMQRRGSGAAPELPQSASADLTDMQLLDKAAAAANGDLFRRLWSGDATGYASQSEADQALCNILAFWTGRDAGRIDKLFRKSGLMREKWNRKQAGTTYGAITIGKAVRDCKTVYNPRGDPAKDFENETLRPYNETDLGQANVFVREYGGTVRYSKATDFLVYDGRVWKENELDAQRLVQNLALRQTREAGAALRKANDAVIAAEEAAAGSVSDAIGDGDSDVKAAQNAVKKAKSYHKWALKQQQSNSISHVLKEIRPQLQIDVESLDADGLLLNTPEGTIDLRSGRMLPHNSDNYCTKMTGVAPSEKNADLYHSFIDQVTCGDKQLARYLQLVAGMCAVGKVFSEKLIIAYGEGGNGKSTLFNLWADVLGDYAGTIPSESLVIRYGNAKEYSIANLRGKRLIIAAELREGARLSTDAVKKMCSTDKVTAEKKYKDPFDFRPSHSIVLYTNILPKVGTNDSGTWDRLVVVPFKATFRNAAGEVKNYAEHLFENCGGAVLKWIIEGAQLFIANGGSIELPECVKAEIEQYKNDNDWLKAFLEDECDMICQYWESAGALYARYQSYCKVFGDGRPHSRADFKRSLEAAGFEWQRTMRGSFHKGLKLRQNSTINDFECGYESIDNTG